MRPLRIATCRGFPGLYHDDAPLPPALARHGFDARPVPWQDIEPGDPVLVRSTWDYTSDPAGFGNWLRALERDGTACVNPVALMRWNSDKRYLLELAGRGHAVLPTRLLSSFRAEAVAALAAEEGWDAAVAKPVVGCGAQGLAVVGRDGAVRDFDPAGNVWAPTTSRRPEGPCLVQPLVPMESGEWSLVFLGGRFSHAALKRPAPGDIRVQSEHGGTSAPAEPPPSARKLAEGVMDSLPDASYARVDTVEWRGDHHLMELELVEPELFLRHKPGSEAAFAKDVAEALARA